MKDLLAWFGLKRFPFDKNIKTADVLETDPFQECFARLEYIKRRGGILLLTGDPGVGKTLALRRFVDSLNENLFKPFYTPLSTLSRADLLYHINRLIGLPSRISKSAIYTQIQAAFLSSANRRGKPSS
jgi:type II secretory pathway predicted ATPase ExeA